MREEDSACASVSPAGERRTPQTALITQVAGPQLGSLRMPRIAMAEATPGEYWVVVNFPGRTSLTLSTNATEQQAKQLMDIARRLCVESIGYAAETYGGGA